MATDVDTPEYAEQADLDSASPLAHERDGEFPSRIVLEPGDLVPIRRQTERERIDDILRADPNFAGYADPKNTVIVMLPTQQAVEAMKRALKLD